MAPSSQEDDLAKEEGGQSYVRLRDPSDYATKVSIQYTANIPI